jgi:LmbE family N-acetylglucosaminyl deacetylase
MDIFLAPHNDDETLFGAFSIIRNKPLVIIVTDGMKMIDKGIDFMMRRNETLNAMRILKASVLFLGLEDDCLTDSKVELSLKGLKPDTVFAPAVYLYGHTGHNIVGRVALKLWGDKVVKYATYQTNDFELKGDIAVNPSPMEKELKERALAEYVSQNIEGIAKVHFDAVRGKPEYYIK